MNESLDRLNNSASRCFAANLSSVAELVKSGTPELGQWDPGRALKLEPNVYYKYIADGRRGTPTWTRVVNLPVSTTFEWKCLRLADNASGPADWQPGPNNKFKTAEQPGYAGAARGSF